LNVLSLELIVTLVKILDRFVVERPDRNIAASTVYVAVSTPQPYKIMP
jgi:hypothetical protein